MITACSKKEDILIDETRYIVDNYAILMLCKVTEQESYKSLMILLKGNEDSLIEAINILQEMDQTVDVKNAMGVAFLRLRKFEEANQYFQMALNLAKETEDKACILSNMSEVMMYTGDFESAENYIEMALNQEIGDSVDQLVLRSNKAAINSSENEDNLQKAIELKKLLKEEKRIYNSNQFIGIFNYKTLAYTCYLDGNMKKCQFYINKALHLNHKTYQYTNIDAILYKNLSLMYTSYDLNKALDYSNKSIEILEKWQKQEHYDLLDLHEIRGNIFLNLKNTKKALEDYQYVLKYCTPYHDLAAVSFYNIAKVYEFSNDDKLVIESYSKAYYIWNQQEWKGLNEDIETALKKIYNNRKDKVSDSFEIWFNEQIERAEGELENQWKQ
jgi:tetratricopeptide (TPR) repeat protein